jgi:arylsulfatase A-like enzyme
MKRREFIRNTAGASLLSLLPRSGLFAEPSSSSTRPNVLFIFSDQHHADLASYAGNPNVHTPALDALAAAGMRFDRAYCQDGICVASRNSLFTGQYPRTLGSVRDRFDRATILSSVTPIQSVFKRAGYYTFTTGKRHLLDKVDVDWDYTASGEPNLVHDTVNYWKWIKDKGLMAQWEYDFSAELGPKMGHPGTLFPPYDKGKYATLCSRPSVLPPEATWEGFAKGQALQFLKSDNAKKPFFAYCGFYRPHQPYTGLPKYLDRIDPAKLVLPKTLSQAPQELPPWLCAWRQNTHQPWNMGSATEADYRAYLANYVALIQEIDDHIRDILDTLEKQGLAENTIVIYSADHGDFAGNHGLVEKGIFGHNFFEDTLRVPFIIRWPGKVPGGVVRPDLVELVDLYPTLLDLCGLPTPQGPAPAGRSLGNTLLRQAKVGRTFTVSENWSQATIITDNYKYGQWLNCPVYPKNDYRNWGNMLMERSTDPHEVKNLIKDPAFASMQKDLQSQMLGWINNLDDTGRKEYFASKKLPYSAV